MTTAKEEYIEKTIDLEKYRTPGAIVLSGRPKGEEIRHRLELDAEDRGNSKFNVIVPKDILSLNSSFFLGLFDKSIKSLGVEKFDAKYNFVCTQSIQEDVEKGKREALNTSNVLKPKK